ncbi:hypothetical protein CK203_063871 [Vitis vinifera]|uniref:DUF4283 domain-containing protein n=1 Tax=Vitis vinifera TaxID=29760 RepID=A0A438G2Z4_VITVI|nr:hypothetical protein CK203_063871 [Vitis vinifera]
MSERACERARARKRVSPPAARMFVVRRIGGKGRRGVLGWNPSLSSWKWREGRKNPNNHHGKQEREIRVREGRVWRWRREGRLQIGEGWVEQGVQDHTSGVEREELSRNLSRLEHCLIGSWSPSNATGEDLEILGWEMAKVWGLKGKMGMASLGKGRVLLEFEFAEEARRVILSGIKAVGGVQVDLERWDPRSGCLEEGETRKEVWVRILGLPISLWVPSVLRRVGDACGGFLDVDSQTESLEELQWARILVRSDGETFPDILELGIEETTYSVILWWEMMPSIRLGEGRKQGLWSRPRREVGGDEDTRAGSRVEQLVGAGTEAQRQSEDGTGRLSQDVGSAVKRAQAQLGLLQGFSSKSGPLASGMFWAYGPKLPSVCEAPKGINWAGAIK